MKKIIVVTVALFLVGCSNSRVSPIELVGAGLGAAAGGLIGYQFGGGLGRILYTAAGSMFGSGVGYMAGRMLSESDLMAYEKTAKEALSHARDGEHLDWANAETGHRGIFRPTRTFNGWDGRYCRDYRATVVLGPELKTAEGTACQQADGQWTPVTEQFG